MHTKFCFGSLKVISLGRPSRRWEDNIIMDQKGRTHIENRVVRRIFGIERNEVIGRWRKLHDEELHNLYFQPGIISVIKSRWVRWVKHIAHMRTLRNAYKIFI
jgi:hypothetical protein